MRSDIFRRRVRRTTLISAGSAAFLGGIGLAATGWSVSVAIVASAIVLLWLCLGRRLVFAVPAAVVVGLVLGSWRGGEIHAELAVYRNFVGQKVTVTGVVAQDATYGAKKQIDFYMGNVMFGTQHVPGQVRVTSFDPVEPKQGDRVTAIAKLKPGFGSYQAGFYYAKVQITGHDASWLSTLRRRFSAAILNVLPEPQASLGLGFLLGIKSQLPDTLTDQLKIVGLTHIVVASGYNLTILVRAARRLLAKRSKYQATMAAVVLMTGFVGVTGFSPSLSRAALVTSLSLFAWFYGRVIHPIVLLLFAAAVTAAISPQYVWGDIGWYLSFLAFGGVMLGAPLLQKRLFGERKVPQLAQVGIETLCAELATLPLTLFVFGSVSVVGLLANVLVVPLTSLAMLTTFIGGLGWIIWPGAGSWMALPAQWILSYMTSVIEWLAAIPWARQPISVNVAGMIVCYGVLLFIGIVIYRKLRYDYLERSIIE